jgi:tetratricopeptide (TPR) repeat protein
MSLFFVFSTCTHLVENDWSVLLRQADMLSETAPDSAYILLQSIGNPEEMAESDFAYWCLISGKIYNWRTDPDKTFLPALYYEQASRYYMRCGTPEQKSYIRLHWGRAYQETGEYNKAMQIYVEALKDAKIWNENNVSGMICCYMGDVYHIQYYTDKSREKYRDAIDYFKLANNQRAIALTLTDIGFEYVFDKKPAEGLLCLLQADSIANLLQDESLVNVSLSLGTVYIELKEFVLAEMYLLRALQYADSKADSTIAYYSLSDVYIAAGDYDKAGEILETGTDSWTQDGVYYQLYLIEKGKRNYEQALVHLEAYQEAIDSTQMEQNKMHALEIEQKYNLEYAEHKRNMARLEAQRNFILFLILLILFSFTIILYQWMRRRKNKIIYEQREELSRVDAVISHISTQLQQERKILGEVQTSLQKANKEYDLNFSNQEERINSLKEELFDMKLEKITNVSAIGKKIRNITEKIASSGKSLSVTEWKMLVNLFRNTFPSLEALLWNPDSSFTESEVRSSLLAFFNLEAKQESRILNIEPLSVYKQRTRLRQKLQLDEGGSLFEYLKKYSMERE